LLNWGGSCGGRNTNCTVTMNGDRSVSATFAELPGVTVSTDGGGGHVAGDVPCGENSDCGPIRFPFGRTIRLQAVLTDANTVGWDGGCTGSGKTCTFNVGTTPGAITLVTAHFAIADPCPPVCGPPAVNGQSAGRTGSRGPLEPARLPEPPDPFPTRRRRRARPGRG
jgi:hypothetical protein